MILPDVNVLIYAYNKGDSRFQRASKWFEGLMNGTDRACFCWETINGFIRISTNVSAVPTPYSIDEAFAIVRGWLNSPNAVLLEPSADHLDILQTISQDANAIGRLHSDAILAAYAMSHNATIASTDRNFRLFNDLKLINPLAEN